MEKGLIRLLKCIECNGTKFQLKAYSKSGDEIIEGNLICRKCRNTYTIKNGILIALPKNLDLPSKLEKESSDNYSSVENAAYSKSKSVLFFYKNQSAYMDNFENTDSIIEIGCGNGFFLEYLKHKKPSFKLIVGVDVSFNALINAKKRTNLNNLIQADSNKLPLIDNSFENVAMQGTIHHINSPQIVLHEIKRILKKSGIVAIQDKNFNNFIMSLVDKVILNFMLGKAGEATLVKRPINHRKLVKLLAKEGFKIKSFRFHDVVAWPSSPILDFLKLDKNFFLSFMICSDKLLSIIPVLSNILSWRYTVISKKN